MRKQIPSSILAEKPTHLIIWQEGKKVTKGSTYLKVKNKKHNYMGYNFHNKNDKRNPASL